MKCQTYVVYVRVCQFLVACTGKLDLGSYARALYDWEGNEIHNLQDGQYASSSCETQICSRLCQCNKFKHSDCFTLGSKPMCLSWNFEINCTTLLMNIRICSF